MNINKNHEKKNNIFFIWAISWVGGICVYATKTKVLGRCVEMVYYNEIITFQMNLK